MSDELLDHYCTKCYARWYGTEWDIDCPRCDGDNQKAHKYIVLTEHKNDPPIIIKPRPKIAFRVIGGGPDQIVYL